MSIPAQQQTGLWTPIEEKTVVGTVYTSPSWNPGSYRRLKLTIRSPGTGAAGSVFVTLSGLAGNYTHGNIYTQGGGAPTSDANTQWSASWDVSAWLNAEIDIRKGGPRGIVGFNRTSTPIRQWVIGDHDDTTHDVTALIVTMSASNTFTVTLEGMP